VQPECPDGPALGRVIGGRLPWLSRSRHLPTRAKAGCGRESAPRWAPELCPPAAPTVALSHGVKERQRRIPLDVHHAMQPRAHAANVASSWPRTASSSAWARSPSLTRNNQQSSRCCSTAAITTLRCGDHLHGLPGRHRVLHRPHANLRSTAGSDRQGRSPGRCAYPRVTTSTDAVQGAGGCDAQSERRIRRRSRPRLVWRVEAGNGISYGATR
jgi:hypothetical protein